MVSCEFFSGLGVSPVVGRGITPEDDKAGAAPVAVISYGYWQRRFGREPLAVGKVVTLNRVPFTIIGVAPPEFFGVQAGQAPDVFVPLHTQPQIAPQQAEPGVSLFNARDHWWVLIMGRLKRGATEQQAQPALDLLFQQTLTAGLNPPPKPEGVPHAELAPASKGLGS